MGSGVSLLFVISCESSRIFDLYTYMPEYQLFNYILSSTATVRHIAVTVHHCF